MNLEYLRAFFTVIEEGSITRAARKLHLSQPALSAQIASLEKYFQTPLLERSSRGVKLTSTGEVLYQEGKRLTNLFDNISTKIEKHKSRPCAELYIGAATTVGNYLLPCTVYRFKATHPQCNIFLEIANSSEIIEKVIQGKVRIGVIEGPITEAMRQDFKAHHIHARRLGADQLVIVAPQKRPWIDKDIVTVDELVETDLIVREAGSGTRRTLEHVLRKHGLKLADLGVHLEFKSVQAILTAVASGYGISILPKMVLKNGCDQNTVVDLSLENIQFSHTLTVIYQQGAVTDKDCSSDFLQLLLTGE